MGIMMRRKIIAGNWKMNKNSLEAIALAEELRRELDGCENVDIVVCPPFTALESVSEALNETNIALGAQNVHWSDQGAFTGEISSLMLKDFGVRYVIIGHSERRQFFGETNEMVSKRIRAALSHQLTPIVCVGENLAEREANKTWDIIKDHCEGSLAGLSLEQAGEIVLAYEPVWAIGTGKTATPQQAQEAHAFIRQLLVVMFGREIASCIRIQYGGSVTSENIGALTALPDIDGALVGGASLKAASFAAIVKTTAK